MSVTLRTTVADVMTKAVVSVYPSMPVSAVAATLYTAAVRAVPVLDAGARLLGVISEADLLAVVAATEPETHRWWRPDTYMRVFPRPGQGRGRPVS